ncbi:Secreted protein F2 [Phytophthora cinnamomi]|uniref:Secreted protein F2 n=1 Tax=Phytophthora cinnamomi TaxID=4785 RepID=UPI00355A87F0|nr:Secreted protein F2 [Phytophthora cinnamomi]
MAPATSSSSSSPLPRELQCAYRSKFCDAPRATKLDGTLHKLCDFHRRKANANQQRLHKRKKRILEQQQAATGGQPQTPRGSAKRARLSPESPQSAAEPIDANFDLLEMRILEVLLFGADSAVSMTALLKDERPVSPTTPSALPLHVPVFDDAWSVTL